MGKITINELSNSLKDYIKDKQDAIDNSLETNNKTIVGAINELVQNSVQNSNKIEESKNRLYDLMLNGGYEVTGTEDIDSLLDLLTINGISTNSIKQVACGYQHAFILRNDGSLWSCGYNTSGQLGIGNTSQITTFQQVTTNINNDVKQVACGYSHTMIVKNDGSLWACGFNNRGQLGLGNSGSGTDKTTFTQVTTNINNDVKQVACGYNHTFIVKNDGSLWACGQNDKGQLGINSNAHANKFTKVTTNINNDVKQVACGYYHTFIVKNDGSLYSCGDNSFGQLGLNNTTQRTTFTQVTTNINNVKEVSCGQCHTLIIKNDGSIWGCGDNSQGQLGLNDNTGRNTFTQVTTNINNDVKYVIGGYVHSYIIKNDGSLWACGYNNKYGQLGFGDTTNRTTFTQVTTNINNDVKQVACDYYHVLIIKNNGDAWGCGYNNCGQLGFGNTTSKTTFDKIPRGL